MNTLTPLPSRAERPRGRPVPAHTGFIAAALVGGVVLAGCAQTAAPADATDPPEEIAQDATESMQSDPGAVGLLDRIVAAREASVPVATEPPAGAVAHYPIEDDLDSAVAGAPPLATEGPVELVADSDPSGEGAAEFGSGGGLELDVEDLLDREHYTVAMRFHLDRGRDDGLWYKLIDFRGGSSDDGFYAYNGSLQVFGHEDVVGGDAPLAGPPSATVVLRRDHDGTMTWFVDGRLAASTPDSDRRVGVSDGSLRFFLDDEAQDSGAEESSGSVSWISLFDEPLDDAAIAALSDPTSWG